VDNDEELSGGDERSSLRARVGRLGPRSLTARIVSGVVVLVVFLVIATGLSTFIATRKLLLDRLDDQLSTTAQPNSIVALLNHPQSGFGGFRVPQHVWVAIVDSTSGKLAVGQPSGMELTALKLSASSRASLAGHSTAATTRTTLDGTRLRMVSVPGFTQPDAAGDLENVTVLIGLSEHDVDQTLGSLLGIELVIGVSAIAIAFVATAGGVRFSLRHLRRVTTTAEEVADELSPTGAGLDRRVPNDEPGTEVGQLATSFNTMLSAVETQFAARLESEQRMRQFMADASHELRTPLTSIRGYAELARMQRAAGDTSDDNLDRIESEGTRMSRLVEDLLTLARGETDGSDRPVQRELISVGGLLDDAASGSRAAFPGRQIDVRLQGEPLVLGDRDQLVRVVRNLTNNAAIHTAAERPILVSGFGDATGATIQVIDGGPGLSPDDAAHVFERFWRADKARTRARGGSGLGLSIVATIVRAHGGTVRFESAVETGSTVTVTLPAAQPASD
jgi:two-component system OmpR family sensor kinase